MRAATIITGIFSQLKELFNVQMPGFQVGADRALSLAALVDRNRCVVDDLQEGHYAL